MKGWFKRIQAWHSGRQQRSLEKWERIRAKGKVRFVVRSALAFVLLMIVPIGTVEFFHDGSQFSDFRLWLISLLVTGIFFGFVTWWDKEGRYKSARLEEDIHRRLIE